MSNKSNNSAKTVKTSTSKAVAPKADNADKVTNLEPLEVKALTPEEKALKIKNEQRAKYEEFLAQRAEKEAQLEIEKQEKKKVANSKQLGKEDYLRLQIYLAGENGIEVHKLLELGKGFTEYNKDGEKVVNEISAVTVNHNWNRKSELLQRGEEKTQDNEDLLIAYDVVQKPSKVNPRKNDNKITVVPFLADNLKQHLINNGAIFEVAEDGSEIAYNCILDVPKVEPTDASDASDTPTDAK